MIICKECGCSEFIPKPKPKFEVGDHVNHTMRDPGDHGVILDFQWNGNVNQFIYKIEWDDGSNYYHWEEYLYLVKQEWVKV
jgi:hypothetical protein